MRIIKALALIIAILCLTCGCKVPTQDNSGVQVNGKLEIYFIDVGHGDSMLLISPNGKTMLIDAGEENCFERISELMTSLSVNHIDVIVATHPHNDHIGSMAHIVESYSVGKLYMPDVTHDSDAYFSLMDKLSEKGLTPQYVAATNDSETYIEWDASVIVRVLAPFLGVTQKNMNNNSIVLRMDYGESSVIFAGDCEKKAEQSLLESYSAEVLAADVLKVAHHGKANGTTDEIIEAVMPHYAVISLGQEDASDKDFSKTISVLDKAGASVLRTDLLGTIHLTLDSAGAVTTG